MCGPVKKQYTFLKSYRTLKFVSDANALPAITAHRIKYIRIVLCICVKTAKYYGKYFKQGIYFDTFKFRIHISIHIKQYEVQNLHH